LPETMWPNYRDDPAKPPARLRDLDVVEGPDMIGSVFVISVKPF
jgi:hypothetical protein